MKARPGIPRNIYEVPFGWYVIIKRGAITYRAFFAFGARTAESAGAGSADSPVRASALARAVAARDAYLAQFPQTYSGQKTRSNTGIPGVSECVKWSRNRAYPCFQVTLGHPRSGIKRFYYTNGADRPRALRAAIAWRKKLEAASLDQVAPLALRAEVPRSARNTTTERAEVPRSARNTTNGNVEAAHA